MSANFRERYCEFKDRAAIRAPARELAPVQLTVHGCEGLTGPGTMTGIEIDAEELPRILRMIEAEFQWLGLVVRFD